MVKNKNNLIKLIVITKENEEIAMEFSERIFVKIEIDFLNYTFYKIFDIGKIQLEMILLQLLGKTLFCIICTIQKIQKYKS
jgi:hypothetical protein